MPKLNSNEESLVKQIAASVYRQLGDNADTDKVKQIVSATLQELNGNSGGYPVSDDIPDSIPSDSTRVIITVFGKNRPGVVAMVSECLSSNSCDILDISQKILQEFFALIMIVDMRACGVSLKDLKACLGGIGNQLGIRILVQHEDVFNYQHRV